jgi:type IV secretion system protein VirD4
MTRREQRRAERAAKHRPLHFAHEIARRQEPLWELQHISAYNGHGLHVGMVAKGWILTRPQRALLVLGPPRGGKTTAVVVPIILSAAGPVISTATKIDVFEATAMARSLLGRVLVFDPSGSEPTPPGATQLRWSPVPTSNPWDAALAVARIMVATSRPAEGVLDQTHWTERATALLAPLLHAAALDGLSMRDVVLWVNAKDPLAAFEILNKRGLTLAVSSLEGIARTDPKEQSGIWSAAAGALSAYQSEAALRACDRPNFDARSFVTGADSLYITAPAHLQQLTAPLVVGLVDEIRRAAYAIAREDYRDGTTRPPVIFAGDELANIAPLPDLPGLVSEGGGQGMVTVAALQDLSQARNRWGRQAEGFLSLFGDKLILPEIADRETLELVSLLVGDYDRRMVAYSSSQNLGLGHWGGSEGTTVSYTRERILPPSAIHQGNGPGEALYLQGCNWTPVYLTPYHYAPPWPQVLVRCMEAYATQRLALLSPDDAGDHHDAAALPCPFLQGAGERVDQDVVNLRAAGGDELVDRARRAVRQIGGEAA